MDNQYLRPEDLPITDAKKSPLALLAMTCSNIGADVLGAGKPMLTFERSKKSRSDAGDSRSDSANSDKIQANSIDSNRSTSRNSLCTSELQSLPAANNCTSSGQKISFKPYEDSPKSDLKEHRSKTNGSSSTSNNNVQDDSRKRSSDAISPQTSTACSSPKRTSSSSSHSEHNKNSPSMTSSSSSSSNVISYTSTGLLELSKNHQLSKAVCDTTASAFNSAPHMSHLSAVASMGQHHPNQHNVLHPFKSAACRDPFCTACRMSSAGLGSPSNCCNGLSACTNSSASGHPFAGYHPGLGSMSDQLSRYSNCLSSQKPFPCHWTANGTYCGKSFSTCEELLHHLKTHTLNSNSSSYAALSPYYNQALSAAGARSAAVDEYRYHPYKMQGSGSAAEMSSSGYAAAFRPLVRMTSSTGYPMLTPPLSMYPPAHPNLSSYYALLNGRLAGPGSLH